MLYSDRLSWNSHILSLPIVASEATRYRYVTVFRDLVQYQTDTESPYSNTNNELTVVGAHTDHHW